MQTISLNNDEYLTIKGKGEPDRPDNAETIKSWGVPGSKVKERVTEKAEAKAAEDKELFLAAAALLKARWMLPWYVISARRKRALHEWLDKQAKKYGQFLSWEEAYDHFMGQENETT